MGQLAAARAAIAEISEAERDISEMRAAAATIHLAECDPEQAVAVLAPAIEGSAPAIHRPSVVTEAQVLDAAAREQLGDERAAEASLEAALELAEPGGLVLPFILVPVRDIVERLPRHRTAHATLRQTILDVLAGSAPPSGGQAAGLREELSEAELRVVRYLPSNLKAPEIASELFVSTEHDPHAPAPHLRQARRTRPRRGGHSRPGAGAALTTGSPALGAESSKPHDDASPRLASACSRLSTRPTDQSAERTADNR